MIIDTLICGIVIWGSAFLLQKKVFSQKPPSSFLKWLLSVIAFFISLLALTILNMISRQSIFENTNVLIHTNYVMTIFIAFCIGWLFYNEINGYKEKAVEE